jgi:hypothetical protein
MALAAAIDAEAARRLLLRSEPERELLANVLQIAKLGRWRVYHTFDSRRSVAGFPDLVLCRPPRVLFVELKREGGRLTAEQDAWLRALAACPGVEVALWTPAMLEEIGATLLRL